LKLRSLQAFRVLRIVIPIFLDRVPELLRYRLKKFGMQNAPEVVREGLATLTYERVRDYPSSTEERNRRVFQHYHFAPCLD